MLRASLLAAVCLGLLTLAPAAEAAKPVRGAAPKSLHGFLLRADEPVDNSFTRTPSFAWKPVPGAIRYQFQLATSSSFRESGLVYSTSGLTSPVAAPTVMLPWITGNPHALFARVRGITASATTPWSTPFGFDMVPGPAPKPLPSEPGLLRWSPIEGADGYEVWFVDINNPTPKMETVFTNVLDEREFYTFHRTASWTSSSALADPRSSHRPHRQQHADPPERLACGRLRPLESRLQLHEPAVRGRADRARAHRLRHRLGRRRRLSRAPPHARVHLQRRPDERRHECGALPRLRLHGPAMPQPCLCKRRDRESRLRTAPVRAALAARLAWRHYPRHAPRISAMDRNRTATRSTA